MKWRLPIEDNRYAVPPQVVLGAGIFTAGVISIGAARFASSPQQIAACAVVAFAAAGALMTLPSIIRRANPTMARALTVIFRVVLAALLAAELAIITAIAQPIKPSPTAHDLENRIYAAGDRVPQDVWDDTDACRSPAEPYEYRQCAQVRELRRQLAAVQSGHPLPTAPDYISPALWLASVLTFWTVAVISTMSARPRRPEAEEVQQTLVSPPAKEGGQMIIDITPRAVTMIEHKPEEKIHVEGWMKNEKQYT